MTFTVWHIVGVSVIVAIVAAVIASVRTRRKDIRKVAYMMDALEDGELNFRFQEKNKFNRTLNRIRTIFEKQRQAHEQDSWTKLIRVLTHEIMNTVSPIASLSDALSKSMDENGHSDEYGVADCLPLGRPVQVHGRERPQRVGCEDGAGHH